jgi:hypothetical protein
MAASPLDCTIRTSTPRANRSSAAFSSAQSSSKLPTFHDSSVRGPCDAGVWPAVVMSEGGERLKCEETVQARPDAPPPSPTALGHAPGVFLAAWAPSTMALTDATTAECVPVG